MRELIMFAKALYGEIEKDNLISLANDLTYKIILSIFPLIIFLLTVIGYLDMDVNILDRLWSQIPDQLWGIFSVFIDEVAAVKRPSILSTSLLFTALSASSGFKSVMRGINKAYGVKDSRNFLMQTVISVVLVLVFALIMILSLVMLIFNNNIYDFISRQYPSAALLQYIFGFAGYFVAMGALLMCVIIINMLALNRRVKLKSLLPGSLFTVLIWLLASRAFNVYVTNYSRYSAIYGSLAGVMLLMLWLNIMCIVLLIGGEINALLEVE